MIIISERELVIPPPTISVVIELHLLGWNRHEQKLKINQNKNLQNYEETFNNVNIFVTKDLNIKYADDAGCCSIEIRFC